VTRRTKRRPVALPSPPVRRGPVLLLTGPPGAGKSTVADLVAPRFDPAVRLETDWFFTTIVRGHIPPWTTEADAQNTTVVRAWATAAGVYAAGGYWVVVDGIIGPWYLDLVTAALGTSASAVHYVVLRPPLAVTLERARTRLPRSTAADPLTAEEPVRAMWERFADLGPFERHVLDTAAVGPREAAELVWRRVDAGVDRL